MPAQITICCKNIASKKKLLVHKIQFILSNPVIYNEYITKTM